MVNRYQAIFDSFENVVLSFSGGKDSGLAYEEMKSYALEHARTFTVYHIGQESMDTATFGYVVDTLHDAESHGFGAVFDCSETLSFDKHGGKPIMTFWEHSRRWLHALDAVEGFAYDNHRDGNYNSDTARHARKTLSE